MNFHPYLVLSEELAYHVLLYRRFILPMGNYMRKHRRRHGEEQMSQRQIFYWFKKEDTLMIHLDCLSYNLYFKSSDLLLYIQNSRSSFALQDNGGSQSQNVKGHSDSTRPTEHEWPSPSQGHNPSLSGKFCHQKVIQWPWVIRRCHFFEQDWQREDPRPYWWHPLSCDLQISCAEI